VRTCMMVVAGFAAEIAAAAADIANDTPGAS
jgi:hypothetical protein